MRLFWVLLILLISPGLFAQEGGAVNVYGRYRAQAEAVAASLDDANLVGQVILTGIEGKQSLSPAMKSLLERIPVGGIMLFRYNLDSSKTDVKMLLAETANLVAGKAGIPPFMAVDHEGGLVHRFGEGVERLPSAFSFWELSQKEGRAAALGWAETFYRRSAREIRDLGINLVLGPVAEILDNDNSIFLETRSYGPDADFTLAAASAYVRSMDAAGIASVVKHFPGNTAVDPHIGMPVMRHSKSVLDGMVKPFAGVIRGLAPQAVMVSHVMLPALDNRVIASLSRPVIEGWLRAELGFQGMVIADDYSMGAAASSGMNSGRHVSVEALNAGVDMIMVWPQNLAETHATILEALRDGRLPRARLRQAAERVIAGKIRYGLIALPR